MGLGIIHEKLLANQNYLAPLGLYITTCLQESVGIGDLPSRSG